MHRTALAFAIVALACKAAPSATPEAAVEVATAPPAPAGPMPTAEPEHPWPVTLVAARGHEALPNAPRQDLWVAMDGIGATVPSGENHQIEALEDGRPAPGWAQDYLLPVLYKSLSEHATKSTLVMWADERAPVETILMALYTAGRAGFRDYAFVVGEPGAREIIRFIPPSVPREGADFQGPAWSDLALRWSPQGVHAILHARYSNVEPQPAVLAVPLDVGAGTCVLPGGARPDPAAVQRVLDEMCSPGKPFALRVELHGQASIGDLVWTLAADRRPASCRLPAVVEAALDSVPPRCDGAQTFAAALASFPPTARRESLDETFATIAENMAILEEIDRVEGSGAGFGGRGKRVPAVKQGKPTVTGAVDPTIIRRVVRAHINEVRHCYDQALGRDPEVAGVVEIAFTIGAKGKTTAADVASSTVTDPAVAACIAKAVRKWVFPRPTDGKAVEVHYPFHLSAE